MNTTKVFKNRKSLQAQMLSASKSLPAAVSLIYGSDFFLRTQVLEMLKKSFLKHKVKCKPTFFWNEQSDLLLSSSNNLSFWDEQQILIHKNSDIFRSDDWKQINDYANALDNNTLNEGQIPNTFLILCCNKSPSQTILKNKKIAIFKTTPPNLSDINYWVNQMEKQLNYKLNISCKQTLLQKLGPNLSLLFNELKKLKTIYPSAKISSIELEEALHQNITQKTFDLIDAFFLKNKKLSLIAFHKLVQDKNFFYEWLALMQRQIQILMLFHEGYSLGLRPAELASHTKTPPFFQTKYSSQMRHWSPATLASLAKALVRLESVAKTAGSVPELLGENFILKVPM